MKEGEEGLRKFTKAMTKTLKHVQDRKAMLWKEEAVCGSLGGARREVGSKAA